MPTGHPWAPGKRERVNVGLGTRKHLQHLEKLDRGILYNTGRAGEAVSEDTGGTPGLMVSTVSGQGSGRMAGHRWEEERQAGPGVTPSVTLSPCSPDASVASVLGLGLRAAPAGPQGAAGSGRPTAALCLEGSPQTSVGGTPVAAASAPEPSLALRPRTLSLSAPS